MQFESRERRRVGKSILLALLPDFVISVAVAVLSNEGVLFFVTLIGLQAIYLSLWLKNTAWAWVLFWLGGRKEIAEHFFYYLKRNGFPEPEDRVRSVDAYLNEVMSNDTNSTELRLMAGYQFAELTLMGKIGQIQASYRLAMGMEDGLERYKREQFENMPKA